MNEQKQSTTTKKTKTKKKGEENGKTKVHLTCESIVLHIKSRKWY